MKQKSTRQPIWLPLAIALAVVVGIFIGSRFTANKPVAENDRKLNAILNLIAQDYVDTTNLKDLIELSIPEILSNLDPHTSYFSAEDLKAATDDLNGSFSGIGISFVLVNDTIGVVEVIPGGPSEKVGLMAGDKIIMIDDSVVTGSKITNGEVMKRLRGDKGTQVKLGIKRQNTDKTLTFTVTRGDIPVNTVDAYYMIDKNTGYIKINQFGRHTYDEFLTAMASLEEDGAKRYMMDLRGNGGGFMEMAVLMANEFLPANQLIVFTKGRYKRDDGEVWSDGNGSFQDAEVAVLIDEYSASASEIFAGAMQDNDRGLIVGCRSFGKGLVQKEFILPDSSAIHLTTARYYTPSGRCIQKDYTEGILNYEKELFDRYTNGELYSRDSMVIDKSQVFSTMTGRTVYGGGGIVPDIFVARDTSGITGYYIDVFNAGLMQRFAFNYCNNNRSSLSKMDDYMQFLRTAPSDETFTKDFADFAAANGIVPRWYYINQSRDLIVTNLKALIA
ncbi:MAG: S41 family peptidase, partial [Muribaculaceae bacterium]|nr:S41 family peptidase [Muribaculaceae bacterium]